MSKMLIRALAFVGFLTLATGPLFAQEPAPTDSDLTLHPGDKITWTTSGVHRVQFGPRPGEDEEVTSLADIKTILVDLTPPIDAAATDTFEYAAGQGVTATVAPLPDGAESAEFNFTCGFNQHTPVMVTIPFKVVPAPDEAIERDVQIRSAAPTKWIMATEAGDVLLGGQ